MTVALGWKSVSLVSNGPRVTSRFLGEKMKRIPPYQHPDYLITQITPRLFWRECSKCGHEIKNEKMWKAWIEDRGGPQSIEPIYEYWCSSCCKNIEQAIMMRDKVREDRSRPPVIPPNGPVESIEVECHLCKHETDQSTVCQECILDPLLIGKRSLKFEPKE